MNILLLGYGKMGKAIEKIALDRNHQIVGRIDVNNRHELQEIDLSTIDAAIEFSRPDAAFENIKFCMTNHIPLICGTTGWLDKLPEVSALCERYDGSFFYASNYSVGVNLFFHFNAIVAEIMNDYPQYDVEMEEIHHTEKLDAPSGTAITIAEKIMEKLKTKQHWVNEPTTAEGALGIISLREPNVPGTHTVTYKSAIDSIELKHTAHSREGFATGAVVAAEWIKGKKGMLGMKDMLGF